MLLDQLNDMRALNYHPKVERNFSARAARLAEYLHSCNGDRGVGFIMFGVVVNLQFLKQAAASAGTVLSTVMVFLVQFGTEDAGT